MNELIINKIINSSKQTDITYNVWCLFFRLYHHYYYVVFLH